MFFLRHPKPVTDRKEVAVLVQQNKAALQSRETVLVAKAVPGAGPGNQMQKGGTKPPPA